MMQQQKGYERCFEFTNACRMTSISNTSFCFDGDIYNIPINAILAVELKINI